MPDKIRIEDFHGFQVDRIEKDYPATNEQYATSSYQKQHNMYPNLIVQPLNEQDVKTAVKWASKHRRAVSVKSGGHQYSGASSTGGHNIQIDLTNSFKDFQVLPVTVPIPDDRAMVLIGVSVTMLELNTHLQQNKLFVPTGQCAYVGVGGHGQTGGYGQLGRSFGLFGDQIRFIRMIDHDGESKEVSKQTDPELFYAILGGSPGNFGIITHYISEVFKSDSYLGTVAGPNGFKGPHGIKAYWIYTHKTLVTVLDEVAKMADNPDLPRGFDLCVSVYSRDDSTAARFNVPKDPVTWERARQNCREVFKNKPEYLKALGDDSPPFVIIYAQWCPTSKDDKYDESVDNWFKTFRDLNEELKKVSQSAIFAEFDMPMSDITHQWLMLKRREFDLPYVKRAYSTTSTTLTRGSEWSKTVADRVDLLFNPKHFHEGQAAGKEDFERFTRCKVVLQIQAFSGKNSMYVLNKDNGTSYSWRDTTVVQVMDCFHEPDADSERYAQEWQAENDRVMIGPNSVFSTHDRRFLWGSHGDWDMKKVWSYYYETPEKYQKLGKARSKADPKGTFTANPFAVEAVKGSY